LAFARTNKDLKVQLLNGVALFSTCNRHELKRIASLVDQVEAPAGKVLAREGAVGREFFVIVEGRAKATR
jgi:CRP-like cAMP-binding protein